MSNKKRGPGTVLADMIPDWAVQFKSGCGCKDMQRKMDKWGVQGCLANLDHIVEHLVSQDEMLIPPFRMLPKPAKAIVAKQLVKHAINKSEKER